MLPDAKKRVTGKWPLPWPLSTIRSIKKRTNESNKITREILRKVGEKKEKLGEKKKEKENDAGEETSDQRTAKWQRWKPPAYSLFLFAAFFLGGDAVFPVPCWRTPIG